MGKGRKPCCDKAGVKKGPWSEAEDMKLMSFIQKHGHSNWRALPRLAGLARCGKSCRLRWVNYLRPDLRRGNFSPQEEESIIKLHERLGNKWSKIASDFPGRTDNEIKNVWNTHLKKRAKAKELRDNSTNDSSLYQVQLDGTETLSQTSPVKDLDHSLSSSSISLCSQASFSDRQMSDYNPKFDQVESPHSILVEFQRDQMAVDSNLLDELIGIPFEPNLDLWELLDGDSVSSSPENVAQVSEKDTYKEDNSNSWWLVYLESELGLDHTQPTPPQACN